MNINTDLDIHVLYLHGFNSSPLSTKAIQAKNYINTLFPNVNFHCPQLASTPKAVIAQLDELITLNSQSANQACWYFIGSSLGGYFATYFAEKLKTKAVLINPAIKPYSLMDKYFGEQVNPYTNEVFNVEESFINDLLSIEKSNILAKNYLIMVQTGDEVLNYQDAVDKYQGGNIITQQGGDHRFVDFDKMLPKIVDFLALS